MENQDNMLLLSGDAITKLKTLAHNSDMSESEVIENLLQGLPDNSIDSVVNYAVTNFFLAASEYGIDEKYEAIIHVVAAFTLALRQKYSQSEITERVNEQIKILRKTAIENMKE